MRVLVGCLLAAALAAACVPALGESALSVVDASARAAGNRKADAYKLGRRLFATQWPAQLTKVRVDAVGSHEIAGLVILGWKFHRPLNREAFLDEMSALVRESFAALPLEEVDVWATVPLPIDPAVAKHMVVSGDYAVPLSRIVFSVTVRRSAAADLAARLRAGRDVYWAPDWEAGLAGQRSRTGASQSR
jgi:hypothetical protein